MNVVNGVVVMFSWPQGSNPDGAMKFHDTYHFTEVLSGRNTFLLSPLDMIYCTALNLLPVQY